MGGRSGEWGRIADDLRGLGPGGSSEGRETGKREELHRWDPVFVRFTPTKLDSN